MGPLVEVRDSVDGDAAEITRIYGHYVLQSTATFEIEPPGCEEMMRRRFTLLDLGLPYLVGELEGKVVGYAYAGLYRPRIGYRYTVEDSVYIDPGHLAEGLGRVLVGELIRRCELGPWRQMVAVIGDTANVASMRLHERFGFRTVGKLDAVGFKFGRWVDSVLMQRALGVGDTRPAV